MDSMLGENKNLKDLPNGDIKDTPLGLAPYQTSELIKSLSKVNKLVTALHMVTDIIDKNEPIRNKLRTLSINIISDTHSFSKTSIEKSIDEILSLLDIASSLWMISEMNCSILKKEFLEIKQFIEENTVHNNPAWLEEFLKKENGQEKIGLGIGIQKGSTLLKALNKFGTTKTVLQNSNIKSAQKNTGNGQSFDLLKRQRRELISKILKDKPAGVSIKDIIISLNNTGEKWGEKTLQRELVSMVNDGILSKTGEKRWSRYFLKKVF